jgi:hypothetical protein
MPMPPLLLADRVLGIDAVAGAVGQKGVIWTETDISGRTPGICTMAVCRWAC